MTRLTLNPSILNKTIKPRAIAFIDPAVTDWKMLAGGVLPEIEIVIFHPEIDGVAQMNDTIYGGKDNNSFCGGEGDDWLSGDQGNDTLTGESGSDRFVLSSTEGTDTITDFTTSEDLIYLSGGVSFEQLSIIQSNEGTLIAIAFTNELLGVLNGVQVGTIAKNNFMTL